LDVGTVLGLVTASGKNVILAPAASDGSQNADCILLEKVDATSADVVAVALRRVATVVTQALVWPGGITTNQKKAALAQLASHEAPGRNGVKPPWVLFSTSSPRRNSQMTG